MLTGEADGVRKRAGERALSGSFCISGSGHYVVDAVREESYAGKLAGEARAFRHPPSPLQDEVNQVIVACTWVMVPLAAILLITLKLRSADLHRGGADGDRRPGHADPRGPGAADERHLRRRRRAAGPPQDAGPADERDREPRRGRHDLRRQDRDADRRRAAPARGRGRRGRRGRRPRTAALARFAASAGDRNRTLETIAERFPGEAGRVGGEVPFSSEWKWSGLRLGGTQPTCWAPRTCSSEAGALTLPPGLGRALERGDGRRPPRRRLRRVGRGAARRPRARRRRRG